MVARNLTAKIVEETARREGANAEQTEKLRNFAAKWSGAWAREREHSPLSVRVACRNFLNYIKANS